MTTKLEKLREYINAERKAADDLLAAEIANAATVECPTCGGRGVQCGSLWDVVAEDERANALVGGHDPACSGINCAVCELARTAARIRTNAGERWPS
jgi:hypothetical protein